jgi:hypothetical protein
MAHIAPEGSPGSPQLAIEPVQMDAVTPWVDYGAQISDKALESRCADSALELEHRVLDPDAVALANLGNLDQPPLALSCRSVDVVSDENVHQPAMTYGG